MSTAEREPQQPGGPLLSLKELAERAGCPPRTIRFYIARGLLPGPLKSGRGACYGEEHLKRLAEIRHWQAQGLTLAEVAARLGIGDVSRLPLPTAWWSYALAPDVLVQVRADTPPWRLRRIQHALQELARLLADTHEPGTPDSFSVSQ
jgi:DNA-binding transcriptional MerR regulator